MAGNEGRPALDLRLRDGSRIAIVGGGPAGTFFAHYARKLAREQGLDVAITICDGKNFARQGPLGCNMCAGVISGPLVDQLDRLGLDLPETRVQHRVDGYYFQTEAGGFALDHPDGRRAIRTVFRGNGPRFVFQEGNVSFDDFLLDRVKAEGVEMVPFPVHEIRLPKDPRERAVLTYGDVRDPSSLEADLVVGAFGLNTTLLERVRDLGFGYQPPGSRRVGQAELHVGREWIECRFHNRIVVLALRIGTVSLAVLTPKGEYVTLTLLGREDVKLSDLEAFLDHPTVRKLLPSDWQLPRAYCHCFPRLAVSPAKRPFADRLVLIGDASFSRYYKNGIESALVTAQLAAETAFHRGISAASFAEGYLRPATRLIVRDNFYGRLLFRLPDVVRHSAAVAEAQQRIVTADGASYTTRALQRSLWNVLTGDAPYRTIFWQLWNPRILLRFAIMTMVVYWEKMTARKGRERHVA